MEQAAQEPNGAISRARSVVLATPVRPPAGRLALPICGLCVSPCRFVSPGGRNVSRFLSVRAEVVRAAPCCADVVADLGDLLSAPGRIRTRDPLLRRCRTVVRYGRLPADI